MATQLGAFHVMRHNNLLADTINVVVDGVVMDGSGTVLDGLILKPADGLAELLALDKEMETELENLKKQE